MAPVEYDRPGYWGPVTATIDWCEANYEVTYYVAEFWNTISNFFMVVPPLISTFLALKDGLETRFVVCNMALFVVGVGSTLFHGTLLYEMQLLDELPMIVCAAVMIYALIEINARPKSQNVPLQTFLLVYCITVSLVYIVIKNPVFQEVAYGALVVGMILFALRIAARFDSAPILFIVGLVAYATGFTIWNLENALCYRFRMMRAGVPSALRPVFQGHLWWHILAGIGTYLCLTFNVHARQTYLKKKVRLEMVLGVWPVVRAEASD